ncbi:hypothetical protein [Thiolapillus sp.]|uniref:Uncharacterized protein n=1 Tax=Thiolapillus brandeum TaxID=1076588 RepID=A0A831RTZ4_9GAMM|nr:hypothetical protein [Thiolapillus sp.]HEC05626.1 hypothetical protein [Thiolapillus brandeum]
MRDAFLVKLSFWLIVIGAFALLTPQPAWPEWLARMILSTGIALAITTAIVKYRESRKKR